MNNFLKFLAGVFAIFFIGSTALAFVLFNVERSAFKAELYVQALEEENVYQRVPEFTAKALTVAAQNPNSNLLMSLFSNLSEEEWRILVVNLIPPDVQRNLAEEAVTQVMAYLNGERDTVALSLTPLKNHLLSPEGVEAVYGFLKVQPDCTVEQLTAMALSQQALTLCNPPETFLIFDVRQIIEAEIRGMLAYIPEQVTIVTADESRVQELRDLQAIRFFMRWSPLLPVLFLLLITLLAVRSVRDWLVWWGYPFLLAGLASMFLSVLSGPMASLTFQIFIAPSLPAVFPAEIVDVFRDLTGTIVRNALQPILLIAGFMALVGLIMAALTFLVRNKSQKGQMYGR